MPRFEVSPNYSWTVIEDVWPNGTLKVWLDNDKNKLWLELGVSVLNPIKPSHVAEIIKKENETKWQSNLNIGKKWTKTLKL